MHASTSAMPVNGALETGAEPWQSGRAWQSILLLSLGFALVSFDRYLILPMFPAIMRDLKLSYTDLGTITGALAITWGLSAFVSGRITDRFGRRKTLVVSMVVFSVLVGFSGLAAGVGSLVLLRALMGFAEGAFSPPSLVATMEAAKPHRKGMTTGLQQMSASLLGLAIAPILVTQLMHYIEGRYIFLIAAPPGLLIAFLLWRTIREPVAHAGPAVEDVDTAQLQSVFRYRNVILGALCMLVWLNAIIVLTAFLPSYFMDFMKLPVATMGFIMSAAGVGAVLGSAIIPGLSDRLGRKFCSIASVVGAASALIALSRIGVNPIMLFITLLIACAFLSGLITMTVGPIAIESVPVRLRATASGTVIAVGEIFGGGVSPLIAGYMAHHFGIASIFPLSIRGLAVGLVACLLLRETAPAKVARV